MKLYMPGQEKVTFHYMIVTFKRVDHMGRFHCNNGYMWIFLSA